MNDYELLRNSVLTDAEAHANAIVPPDMAKTYGDGRTGEYWSVPAGNEWNKVYFAAVEGFYREKKAKLATGPILSEAEKKRIRRNHAIIEAHREGLSLGKIALTHGISKQRVCQIVRQNQYATFDEVY